MGYRVEYVDSRRCTFADNRQELIRQIKAAVPGTIEDIRKSYKNGISDSVIEKYEKYISK